MMNLNRNSDATFRVFQQSDGTYAVEITIPDAYPTTVTNFATEAAAEDWLAGYKQQVEAIPARGARSWRNRTK